MSESAYVLLLDLACGALLITAGLVLWRRELAMIIRIFAVQGVALAGIAVVLSAHEGSAAHAAVAVVIVALRVLALPWLLRRVLRSSGETRETQPLVNVSASLVAAAVLTLLAYAVSQPLVELAPSASTHAIPIGMTVVLIGFFALVTRRRALSQVIGFLLIDNGITAVGLLTAVEVPLVVELGVALDVLFAVLVLQILAMRMRTAFGNTDLDELRELRDS